MSGDAVSQYDRDQLAKRLDELTERVGELEGELERAQRLATLGTLSGAIAHEFNNILTPVMSYAQMAMHQRDDEELVTKALRKAVDGTQKAAHIASSMLGFIRDDPTDHITHVRHAVEDTLGCLAREPAKDGIEVELDIGEDCWVAMRPVALQQILLNLVLNAQQAMPKSGKLTIRARCSTWNTAETASLGAGDDVVEINIADTGGGIPADLIERVFEPFVRGPGSRAGRAGTGLGLAVCKRLVQDAGGKISVTSEEGAGSTFTLALRRAVPDAGQRAA